MATSILLLRHAQSVWNAQGRWQGWADPPLSPAGERAASSAADHGALDGIDASASSDLQRAARTAELLAGGRAWPPVRRYRGLRERGAGHWTGLTRPQIEERWPGALGPPLAAIAGGESPEAVTARAVAALHRIAGEWPDGCVLAVTHGALIRLVEQHAGAEPAPVPNLGGRWIDVDGNRLHLGERVDALVPASPVAGRS